MMEGQATVSNLGQISNVVSLNGSSNAATALAVTPANIANLATVPAGATVTVPVSGMSAVQGLAFYNYPDNVGQIISNTGAPVHVDLSSNPDIARQLNQQMQTQYGQIQLHVVQAPAAQQATHIQPQVIPIQIQQQQIQQVPAATQQQSTVTINTPQHVTIKTQPLEEDPLQAATSELMKKSRSKAGGSERVPCPQCDKTVSCTATLKDHMRTHTGERPFKCTECRLAFSQRSNLRMHKRLHTGERPYMCGVCGKTFARSSHLPAHMRTHTGEKPFVCPVCKHAFITAQQLKNHNRVHTGEKPWRCDQCPAAFTHSSSLSTHKKKHTGNKPFQCEKCSKKFFFTSALDKHMKVHSKNRPFKCPTCENAFKYKESLTVHMERYCGKQTEKKQRAPRKPDAKKPGPKPGTGRKYVQQRKGRPRGRPRKKGRWAKRGKKGKQDKKESVTASSSSSETVLGIKNEITEKIADTIVFQADATDGTENEDENIPVAELKVENIEGTNEARVIVDSVAGGTASVVAASGESGTLVSQQTVPGGVVAAGAAIATDSNQHHQQQQIQTSDHGSNIVQLDPGTSFTVLSTEELERHMAAGSLQLLTIPPDMVHLMQNTPHAQIISSEQLQQLQQQQQPALQQQSIGHTVHQAHAATVQQQQQHVQVTQPTPQQQQHQHQQQLPSQQIQLQQVTQQQQQLQQPTVLAPNSQPSNTVLPELVVKDGAQVYYSR